MLLKPSLKDFEYYLVSMWNECNCAVIWIFFSIALPLKCSTLTASSFRIWNSSAGIPSPPLALCVVMLPKAHLTSPSRMSALGEWPHHHSYLGHQDLFLYSSSVYTCHLFLISSASVRYIPFLSFIVHVFAWNFQIFSSYSDFPNYRYMSFWRKFDLGSKQRSLTIFGYYVFFCVTSKTEQSSLLWFFILLTYWRNWIRCPEKFWIWHISSYNVI